VKVFEGLPHDYKIEHAVVTVGMYDGVHLAHKLILQRVCNIAKTISGESVLVTFEPHPRLVLNPNEPFSLLSTREEKIALIESIGIDVLIFLPFSIAFSKMSSYDFVKIIIVDAIHARKIVVGYNHYFGHNREGNFAHLSKLGTQFGFEVEEIPEQDVQNESVSSSKIRLALSKGDMMKANTYLDYDYPISGNIIAGNNVFSDFGYRAWDLDVGQSQKIIPAEGLYFVNVLIENKSWKGAVWISCSNKSNNKIHLLLVDDDSALKNEFVSIQFKYLVRFCTKQATKSILKSSIESIIYKATH
jgi:riboflavin kinase/FMN adenylyltransferase